MIKQCKLENNDASVIGSEIGVTVIANTEFLNHRNSALVPSNGTYPMYIEACTFHANVGFNGGAVSFSNQSTEFSPPGASLIFRNCVFSDNEAVVNPDLHFGGHGGAVYVYTALHSDRRTGARANLPYPFDPYWPPVFVNCTFAGNRAEAGGALYWLDDPWAKNGSRLGAMEQMVIANCIFWDNGLEPIAGKYAEIAPLYTGTFTHCIIEGGFPGTSILNLDPKFRDAANGDFRLMPDSPAIDRGRDSSAAAYGGVVDDFLGCPRGYDGDGLGAVTGDASDYDIGAFEYVPECSGEGEGEGEDEGETSIHTADQDGDGRINLSELLRIVQFFNAGGFHCADDPAATEDGYLAGSGPAQSCRPHASDYNGGAPDWQIDLTELLRLIQFFSAGGYYWCPEAGTEDGYCPGAG
jgi:hypothetical protein